ncbi:MAG: NRDE family protein [Acidobacteria bacterium]|nr:MAG: NRDE family protein [Acidobacteriota bacterium]REK02673.1 MAG: NRDE family protein [Acidobacteriota bacterium]REK13522.1 MAG: NRDE family protein [Acidobacteriota bacterium]REK41516.1 MAG: NRDE family protein [Acidobacteriota bacterium]
MCTILFSYRQHEETPLILLANRDEFYERPTQKAGRWDDAPGVFAGRDMVAKGTWLGVTDSGKIAAVTNYREPGQEKGTRSRGRLVSDFLTSDTSTREYLEKIERSAGDYSGFNLLVGELNNGTTSLFYFSNRGNGIRELGPGLYGISNHLLDTPWPKVERGKARLKEVIDDGFQKEDLFGVLTDRTLAEDEDLPDTGVGYIKEKILSPIFIETPIYGTRSSTIVTYSDNKGMELEERVHV